MTIFIVTRWSLKRGENKIQCIDCSTGTYNKSHFGKVTSLVKRWSLLENGLYVTQLAALFF